ncbi:PAS domain-containing protein [Balneolaceae bacterium ANBcel3]|nr:PAS domain-containing protein [Balneolaceae bacterium ANBcel3]
MISTKEQQLTVDKERLFRMEELFFSTTDSKGVITFANEVFTRISGYTEKELIGQPHNIIRHPDMPRAVFFLLWDYIKKGEPMAAYVKNKAKDGSHYWVMALVFPHREGYLSIRLKPGSDLFKEVKKIYKKTLTYERDQSSLHGSKKGMMAAVDYLQERLKEVGFESYDRFMWIALENEMRNRELELRKKNYTRKNSNGAVPPYLLSFENHLVKLFDHLKSLKDLHAKLIEHAGYILQLSRSIRMLSLNAQVGSSRLDDGEGDSLSAVAGQMGEQSMGGERMLAELQKHVTVLSRLLNKVNFDIITAKLQVEMSTIFMNEIHEKGSNAYLSDIPVPEVVDLLKEAYAPRLSLIADEVGQIPSSLRELRSRVYEIERFLYVLRFIHSAGKIEVARLEDATSFANTFQELIREVNTADGKLKELSGYIEENQRMNPVFLESERVLSIARNGVHVNGSA